MQGATHFIECWYDTINKKCHQGNNPIPIGLLGNSILNLHVSNIPYAIIYIKPKK